MPGSFPAHALLSGEKPWERGWRNTFESLSQELAATGSIPQGNRFGKKAIPLPKQVLIFVWFISNLEATRSVSDKKEGPYQAPKAHTLRTGTFAKPSFITFAALRSKAI